MLSYIAGYTILYRLVQVYRILREMAIDCHKTCINCYHARSYEFYSHCMAILLESYTPGQGGINRYPVMYNSMPFHAMEYDNMVYYVR
jgi:hypothetical protein